MFTLLIFFAIFIIMLLLWIPLANAGVQFTDGIGSLLCAVAVLIVLSPFIFQIIKKIIGRKK